MKRIVITSIMAVCMLAAGSLPTFAVESNVQTEEQGITQNIEIPEDSLPDSDELFAGYVEQEMYDTGISLFSLDTSAVLSDTDKKIYDILKTGIKEVADGECSSAVITFSIKDVFGIDSNTRFSKEDLGVSSLLEDNSITTEAVNAIHSKISFDDYRILRCLLSDCPYELYWFDKTVGVSYSIPGISGNSTYLKFSGEDITFSFRVSSEYSIDSVTGSTNTDTEKTGAVTTAVTNAKAIVEKHAGEDDYTKLVSYRNEICNLVSYNTAAASSSTVPYGNPWQLIWVFDGDETTKVVCEGYSKAFQYLCDLSEFVDDNITCWTVTGTMSSGNSSGGHMWNIMTMDDNKNYLVDVTNCDTGTIGAVDKLFLAIPSSGTASGGYSFSIGSSTITYVYDDDTKAINDGILTLNNVVYSQCIHSWGEREVVLKATCVSQGSIKYTCSKCGKTKTEYTNIDPTKHTGGTEVRDSEAATCEEAGYTGDTYCLGCKTKINEGTVIEKLGHTYGVPAFSWSEGGKACTVTLTCANDHSHTLTDDATVTSSVKTAATCVEKGTTTYTATYGKYNDTKDVQDIEIVPDNHVGGTEIRDAKSSTCVAEGYTGDTYCKGCGKKLKTGTASAKLTAHTWNSGVTTKAATATAAGIRTYSCTVCGTTKSESISALGVPTKGKTITDTGNKVTYKVTKSGLKNGTVEYVKCTNTKATSVTIPATVKIDGITYKVTSIAANAFKGNNKITKVIIGNNINKIGKNAFYKAGKLKTVTIKTTLLSSTGVGAKAFSNINAKATVKVPKKKLTAYTKILKKKGITGKKQKIIKY